MPGTRPGMTGDQIAASLALAASGLSAWIAADPGMAGAARAMQQASFAAGGPAFAAGFGLLAAGVSVTAGLTGLLPRWTMWLGLFVGAAGELSALGLVVSPRRRDVQRSVFLSGDALTAERIAP